MKASRYRTYLSVLVLGLLSFPAWAARVEAPGIPNFQQVNDHIFRGGQPSDEGWQSLSKLGVKTVIDLRREGEGDHSTEAEAQAVQSTGMRYIHVPMEGIVAPADEDVAKVLSVFQSTEPVFVHCKEGKDRTGTVVACYRIAHDGWQNQKAMDEAKRYGIHWFEVGMKSYIVKFQPPAVREARGPALQPVAAAHQN